MANIIQKLIIFPRLWKAISLMTKAWNLTALGKNSEAEEMFEEGERKFLKISNTWPYEYKIMKGYIKQKVGKFEEAIDLLQEAWKDIEKDDEISSADKIYLKEYISAVAMVYEQYANVNIGCIEHVYPEEIPLNEVSPSWKKQFPCRDHPDWDKYRV